MYRPSESTRPADDAWYNPGLNFSCTRCGNCCTGAPGHVWVTPEEVRRIAQDIGRQDDWLPRDQLRREGFAYSLTENDDGDCVFLKWRRNGKAACTVYHVRPTQCRTWPFWSSNLESPATWNRAAVNCPGMSSGSGTFVSIDTIRVLSRSPSPTQPGDHWPRT